ncbi:MAG: hypothetical protein K0R82_1463 [Flavipsychrobacter sp.]|jgi:hypothetical protein|nr:hypothetical protein [Flavipsychrobacter sp.]
MKRVIGVFGLISGAICVVMMILSSIFREQIGWERSMAVGYTTMILSLGVIFFAVQSYKNNVGDGYVSFGRAFKIGLWITLISSAIYAGIWLVIYYNTEPNIMEQYYAHMVEKMKADGASQAELAKAAKDKEWGMKIFDNPVTNFLWAFIFEPFPIGLIISLITALILRSKKKPADLAANA